MKKYFLGFFLIIGMNAWSQSTEFFDNFNDNILKSNWGVTGTTFAINEADSVLNITYNRTITSGQWDQVHLYSLSVNADNNPYLSFDLKSDVAFVMAVKPVNSNGGYDWLEYQVPGDNEWHSYAYELYNSLGAPITGFYIYFDGGSTSIKSGNVQMDNFYLGIPSLPNDYSLLTDVSEAAKKLKTFIMEGTEEGEYPSGSINKLQTVADISDTLLKYNDLYSQGYLDSAANDLFDSITFVETSVSLNTRPLVDSLATLQTVYLYKNLQYISGKHHVLYGQHNTLASGAGQDGLGWYDDGTASQSDSKLITGSHPAVNSQDANNVIGHSFRSIVNFKNRQVKTYLWGGVNTLCNHMYDPAYGQIYYSDMATPYNVVTSILPGGQYNTWYKNNLYHLALYFKSLRGENGEVIPVIFRPFHEHNGSWFWWGKGNCTVDQYNEVWRYTVQYLRDTLNVHNLIYAISPDGGQFTTKAQYISIYPGDDYVDVFGLDYYFRTNLISARDLLKNQMNYIVEYADASNKLAALTEFGDATNSGKMKIPDFFTSRVLSAVKYDSKSSRVSYIASWSNNSSGGFYAPYPGQEQAPDFLNFYDDTTTIFMNDVVELYDSLLNDGYENPMQGCRIKTFSVSNYTGNVEIWKPDSIHFSIVINIPDTIEGYPVASPVFTNSEGSIVKVNGEFQESGVNVHDFSDTLKYIVIAQNNSDSSVYSVTVNKVHESALPEYSDISPVIYPNPVTSVLFLKDLLNVSKIELFDLYGHKIYSLIPVGKDISIDMESYDSGIYLLKVIEKTGKVKIIKITKER